MSTLKQESVKLEAERKSVQAVTGKLEEQKAATKQVEGKLTAKEAEAKELQAKIKGLEAELAKCRAGGDSAGKEAEQWKTKATKLAEKQHADALQQAKLDG